jgi:hypothetical protein
LCRRGRNKNQAATNRACDEVTKAMMSTFNHGLALAHHKSKNRETDGIYKRFQRLKQPGNPLICRLVVTPVPNFLFSEQKLKMLPQGGACAMFSTSKYKSPLL